MAVCAVGGIPVGRGPCTHSPAGEVRCRSEGGCVCVHIHILCYWRARACVAHRGAPVKTGRSARPTAGRRLHGQRRQQQQKLLTRTGCASSLSGVGGRWCAGGLAVLEAARVAASWGVPAGEGRAGPGPASKHPPEAQQPQPTRTADRPSRRCGLQPGAAQREEGANWRMEAEACRVLDRSRRL